MKKDKVGKRKFWKVSIQNNSFVMRDYYIISEYIVNAEVAAIKRAKEDNDYSFDRNKQPYCIKVEFVGYI